MATLHGRSPPPYTFVTGDLNFLQKNWLKSVINGPTLFKDALKGPITIIPPSITTTHHDGGLPSSLSCARANNNPPLPSMPTQCSRQNLRERCLFQNNGWTEWEVVQLADKLEAKQTMEEAKWD
jgi:hypothetical protein